MARCGEAVKSRLAPGPVSAGWGMYWASPRRVGQDLG